MSTSHSSNLLRKQLRLQRQSLSPAQQTQHAQRAQQHFIHFLAATKLLDTQKKLNIAFFLAQDGELSTDLAIQYLWHSTPHKIWLPILKTNPTGSMAFAEYTANTPMKKNKFAILEPDRPQNTWISGQELDLVLMPLVGFDAFGNRMGMGG
ncbi:MAG TPA: 5-formyltetrahydrofolate cyclo-ligase, partial [Thiomicrorhabdus sp.]|nr:5-formyltetrahydrofolate cyclo-ligase [Thiomicrorhabdus sp.]